MALFAAATLSRACALAHEAPSRRTARTCAGSLDSSSYRLRTGARVATSATATFSSP